MTLPPCLRERDGAFWLSVKAQSRARRTEVAGLVSHELKLKTTAPPVASAANAALVEFLAETLGCPRRVRSLVRGQTSAHKGFRLEGMSAAEAVNSLQL